MIRVGHTAVKSFILNKINSNQARERLIACIKVAVSCKTDFPLNKHPLRIIQSAKSLIGLNPEVVDGRLIDWLENYIYSFEIMDLNKVEISPIEVEDYASMIEFENHLNNGNFNQLKIISSKLLTVSSGEPLFESILYYSLKRQDLFLFNLSLYRSLMFCSGEDKEKFLGLAIKILKENFEPINNINIIKLNLISFGGEILDLVAGYMQIINLPLVRKDKIKSEVPKIIFDNQESKNVNLNKDRIKISIKDTIVQNDSKLFEIGFKNELILNNRMAFNTLIKILPTEKYNPDLIQFLDSARTVIRYCKDEIKLDIYDRIVIQIRNLIFND